MRNYKVTAVAIAALLGCSSLAYAGPPDDAPPPENMGTQQSGAAIAGLTGATPPDGKLSDCMAHVNLWIVDNYTSIQTACTLAGHADAGGQVPSQ